MTPPRVTRHWLTQVPVWSTDYAGRTNWSLLNLIDMIPLVYAFLFLTGDAFDWVFGLGLVWALIRVVRRIRRRARACEQRGYHNAYQPVEAVDDWYCWDCEEPLGSDSGEQAAARAAEAVREGRPKPQSFYSNRR